MCAFMGKRHTVLGLGSTPVAATYHKKLAHLLATQLIAADNGLCKQDYGAVLGEVHIRVMLDLWWPQLWATNLLHGSDGRDFAMPTRCSELVGYDLAHLRQA